MAQNPKYTPPLIPGSFYHIYNRTNNKEELFVSDESRHYFLERFQNYLCPYVETYLYALLDNHFHFLVSVRPPEIIHSYLCKCDFDTLSKKEKYFLTNPDIELHTYKLIETQFLRFFTSYSMSFNNFHYRKGNLFTKSFKRVEVTLDSQLTQLIFYIHNNPLKYGIIQNFIDCDWTSYRSIVSNDKTFLNKEFILNWFGGREEFIKFHEIMRPLPKASGKLWFE